MLGFGCRPEPGEPAQPEESVRAFVGARIIDGSGNEPVDNAVILVRAGRIEAIGASDSVEIPQGAQRIDLAGKSVIPGLINAHGHVGASRGLLSGPEYYTEENILDQTVLYARYGVTTVLSLGDDGEAGIRVRESQDTAELDRARLYVAGPVIAAETPEEARRKVSEAAAMNVDIIKIRVDDFLGTREKMAPEVYQAVIDQAHQEGLRVAAHLFYLEDAKSLLRSGVDFVAHSVRDQEVDAELISLLKERDVCLCPTLTREVSTFVYESRPEFFDDPFFLREADQEVLDELQSPERQEELRDNPAVQQYKQALEVASRNLKTLADAGVVIAFGTDSGPPGRFQGYFEHMEFDLMSRAGLSPMQILMSATSDAADCLELDQIGMLEPGKWADMVVLDEDPLADIRNLRSIHSVWIAGNQVPE